MHYNSHGFPCSHHPPASPSNIHQGLFIIVSSLVDFPVGWEQRFTSLVGNMCAKLISTSHAARKHRGFSCADKKTRHLTKTLWQSCPSLMRVRGCRLGAAFKSWSERCLNRRELLAVNSPLPGLRRHFRKKQKRPEPSYSLSSQLDPGKHIMRGGCKLLMTVVPIGTLFSLVCWFSLWLGESTAI